MKRLSGPRFWEHHELFGVAFKSQSCWDWYFQVTLNNKGWCVSQLHYHYIVVLFVHIRNLRLKKTFPINIQLQKKKKLLPNVISSSCLYKYITNVFPSIKKKRRVRSHPLNSEQPNLLGPPNKFHILHVRNLHQKMAKTVKSFGSNLCPRLTS